MEKIIVAFESEKTALRVKELLEGGGAAACLVCRTADQVRRAINKLPVPAVVCGYKPAIPGKPWGSAGCGAAAAASGAQAGAVRAPLSQWGGSETHRPG